MTLNLQFFGALQIGEQMKKEIKDSIRFLALQQFNLCRFSFALSVLAGGWLYGVFYVVWAKQFNMWFYHIVSFANLGFSSPTTQGLGLFIFHAKSFELANSFRLPRFIHCLKQRFLLWWMLLLLNHALVQVLCLSHHPTTLAHSETV